MIRQQIRGPRKFLNSPEELLSDRELQVFQLIGQWRGTGQIARELHLSVKTVEYYRRRLRRNFTCKRRPICGALPLSAPWLGNRPSFATVTPRLRRGDDFRFFGSGPVWCPRFSVFFCTCLLHFVLRTLSSAHCRMVRPSSVSTQGKTKCGRQSAEDKVKGEHQWYAG